MDVWPCIRLHVLVAWKALGIHAHDTHNGCTCQNIRVSCAQCEYSILHVCMTMYTYAFLVAWKPLGIHSHDKTNVCPCQNLRIRCAQCEYSILHGRMTMYTFACFCCLECTRNPRPWHPQWLHMPKSTCKLCTMWILNTTCMYDHVYMCFFGSPGRHSDSTPMTFPMAAHTKIWI